MDFIINHSGFFLGIGLVVLLAIIGYYADKNDTKNKKVDNKNDDVEIDDYVVKEPTTFNELPNVEKKINDVVNDFNEFKKDNSEVQSNNEGANVGNIPEINPSNNLDAISEINSDNNGKN